MKAVPLGSQNTVEFTSSLPFSQHNRPVIYKMRSVTGRQDEPVFVYAR
jgi:hypothetical protein